MVTAVDAIRIIWSPDLESERFPFQETLLIALYSLLPFSSLRISWERDLQAVVETTGQAWAQELQAVFLAMHQATERWREAGQIRLSEQAVLAARVQALLALGDRQCPRQVGNKQTPTRNLLEALQAHQAEVLAFLYDLRVPFTNNQAERDLRMVKVQQKITSGWRTEAGATIFCRLRSVISCLRKQGRDILATLRAFFRGESPSLLPVAS